ncbi:hypothetical protein QAD02_014852 [Eretmocerus hayati]|uniref:Uncharacterized protein n=1 Tax=Eretmocerus hayati TaxID=131215 RepID=A0ACC2PBD6_9HYME|nr:hypothetical protein QAD02_014852 [Eretmocerus hayati]
MRDREVSYQIRRELVSRRKANQNLKLIFRSINKSPSFVKQIGSRKYQFSIKEMHDIDSKFSIIMTSLDQLEIFHLLLTLVQTSASQLIHFQLYEKSVIHLIKLTEYGLMSHFEIVQLLHYIGMMKQGGGAYVRCIEPLLPNFNQITLMDKAVIALAYFKTHSELPEYQLKSLEDALENESEILANNHFLLVTLCKAVGLYGSSADMTLKNLSNTIIQRKDEMDFRTSTHVLGVYAGNLILEKEALEYLITDGMKKVAKDERLCSLRLKDVNRYFWARSCLYWTLTEEEKQLSTVYLNNRYKELSNKENLEYLVRILVSLFILQCTNLEPIIKRSIDEGVFNSIFQDMYDWKLKTEFQLLMNIVKLKTYIIEPHQYQDKIQLNFTPSENLITIEKIGSQLAEQGLIKKAFIQCPVDSLMLPGLTVVTEKGSIHIDVLDRSTCMKNSLTPHGRMQLKLQLVRHLGYQHVFIDGNTLSSSKVAESALVKSIKEILVEKEGLSSVDVQEP